MSTPRRPNQDGFVEYSMLGMTGSCSAVNLVMAYEYNVPRQNHSELHVGHHNEEEHSIE
jgi:hypothetical protein